MPSVLETFYTLFESKTDGVKKGADEAKKAVDDVEKHVQNADKSAKQLGNSFNEVAKAVGKIGAAFLTLDFVKNGMDKALIGNTELDKQSKLLQINANDLAAWDSAARASGAQTGELTNFIHGLYTEYAKMGRADLIPGILDKLKEWNRVASTMSANDSFRMFSQMGVPEDLIRFLQMAPDQFDKLIQKQHELAAVTNKDTQAARDFSVAWGQTEDSIGSFFSQLDSLVLPVLTKILNFLNNPIAIPHWLETLLNSNGVTRLLLAPMDKAGGGLGGGDAQSKAMKYFMDQGWTKNQASGILANLMAESKLNPGAVGDSGLAYGIAQWHPDRQKDFRDIMGHDIKGSSLEEQLAFVQYELTKGKEKARGDALRQMSSAYDSGFSATGFERPRSSLEYYKRGELAENLAAAQKQISIADTTPLASLGSGSRGSADVTISTGPITINTQATDSNGIAMSFADNLKMHLRNATGNWNDGVDR